jgi:hypothetical protein
MGFPAGHGQGSAHLVLAMGFQGSTKALIIGLLNMAGIIRAGGS